MNYCIKYLLYFYIFLINIFINKLYNIYTMITNTYNKKHIIIDKSILSKHIIYFINYIIIKLRNI